MLFPYNTDAPIYHFPYGTIGLIVANVLLFFATMFGIDSPLDFEGVKWLCLEFDQINPFQWVSNNFMHGDIVHLVGNMVFLWAFGLVVEGKLGWRRYLMTYLAIGAISSAFTQIVMFSLFRSPQCALGASGIIYGLMGMAFIWAPKNDMHCFLWLGVFSRTIELPVVGVCGFYFALQVLFFVMNGFHMSSEALHLIGLAVGLPMGVIMLKRGWADCEGWDLFNVMQGTELEASREARLKRREDSDEQDSEPPQTIQERRIEARNLIRRAIVEKQHRIVWALLQKHAKLLEEGRQLHVDELAGVLTAMQTLALWKESIPLLRQGIARDARRVSLYRLRLAQILLQHEERPRQAMAVLQKLPPQLPEKQLVRRNQIMALARKRVEAGALEVDLEQW